MTITEDEAQQLAQARITLRKITKRIEGGGIVAAGTYLDREHVWTAFLAGQVATAFDVAEGALFDALNHASSFQQCEHAQAAIEASAPDVES